MPKPRANVQFPTPAERAAHAGRVTPGRGTVRRPAGLGISTADRIYDADELELLRAVDRFRDETGVRFPTPTMILAILKGLGWRKADAGP